MSDTPRTDAAWSSGFDPVVVSAAELARRLRERCAELERENAALRSIAAAMAEEMEQHGGELAFDSLARYRAALAKEAKP